MVHLTIGNSYSSIKGFSQKQLAEIKAILSYQIDANKSYYSGGWRSRKRYLIDRHGNFPTGLLYLVEKYLANIEYARLDTRAKPNSLNDSQTWFIGGEHPTPYPEQIEAAKAVVLNSRGIVVAPTGSGKSLIAALIIDALKVPTLIVVPTLELRKQLIASLSAWFGDDKVGGLKDCTLVAVENVDALKMTPLHGYDLVIIDEFHHSAAKTYRNLNKKSWDRVYYKIGLTATPFRSNDNERLLLESILSKEIYRIHYLDAVKNGRIVPMEAYYIELPRLTMQGNESSWASVYSELIVNNEYRNMVIVELLDSLKERGSPTLCLVKEIAHGNIISDSTGVPFANGSDVDTRIKILEFNTSEIKQLIGTSGILGEGVDTKPAEWIILAGGGKSKNQFMQQCGRGFRTYPGKESCKVILFKDPSHKYLLRHFKECCKFLKEEYGIVPVKLN